MKLVGLLLSKKELNQLIIKKYYFLSFPQLSEHFDMIY